MRPRLISILAAAAMLAVPTGSALGSSSGEQAVSQSGDIVHIKNLGGWSGSDIEFASREVTKLSNGAKGTPVCATFNPDGSCATVQKEIRDFAVAGALGANARVIDITNPADPIEVGQVPCALNQNDIQIKDDLIFVAGDSGSGSCKKPNGSSQGQVSSGILDFSDPRNPKFLSKITYSRGSHNHTVHPTKPYIYLSDSDLAGLGNIPIYDISNPSLPVAKTPLAFGPHSPHDITFNASGSRAYVAAVSTTYILNTEDPAVPTVVGVIPNEGISIAHQADPTPDGKYLLVTDELGGGLAGVSPGGPVHVYDIRQETKPIKIGVIETDCVPNSCHELASVPVSTAHVLRINPDGYTMAIAWYKDGVNIIDYSAIRGANAAGSGTATGLGYRTIGHMRMPNANTWSAKMWQERHPGYVFANDISRGLDVFYVSSLGPQFLAAGTIHGGNPATAVVGGVSELEFSATCDSNPVSEGVDGWIVDLPAGADDGTHKITLNFTSQASAATDLDIWWYDEGCGLVSTTGSESGDTIPEGARYVVVDAFTGGLVNVNINYI